MTYQTQTLAIPAHALHGMAIAAAKKDVRYYLQGVLLECRGGLPARLVATDGSILAAWQSEAIAAHDADAILPLEFIKQLPKNGIISVTLMDQGERPHQVTATTGNAVLQSLAMDGKYPDYRRILPDAEDITEPTAGHYNPELLKRLNDCARMVLGLPKKSMAGFYQRGLADAALAYVPGVDTWAGVVMPLRVEPAGIMPGLDARNFLAGGLPAKTEPAAAAA